MDINKIEVDTNLVNKLEVAKELAELIGDRDMVSSIDEKLKLESSKFNKMIEALTKSLMY